MKQLSLLALLVACGDTEKPEIEEEIIDTADDTFDLDGDGYTSDEDCDDSSSAIFPNAEDIAPWLSTRDILASDGH